MPGMDLPRTFSVVRCRSSSSSPGRTTRSSHCGRSSAGDQLTVRLTRDIWRLEQRHVHLARAVSVVARAHGGVADRSRAQEVQLAIAGQPDAVDVGFWRAVLGYAGMADDNAVDPLGHGS